jgi:hypothetical protein
MDGSTEGYEFIGVRQMPWQEFAELPDHPHQRNTVERAHRRPVVQALSVFDEAHRMVTVASLAGVRYKVDGHTRVHFWKNGLTPNLPQGMTVHASMFSCTSMAALNQLYHRFDSPSAVENLSDKIYGATQALHLNFKSPLMRAMKYGSALKYMSEMLWGSRRDTWTDPVFFDALLDYFSPELRLFDDTNPLRKRYLNSFIIAALLCFMRDGPDASEFWTAYNKGEGMKQGRMEDGVEAVTRLFRFARDNNWTIRAHYRDILARILNAYTRPAHQMFTSELLRARSQEWLNDFIVEAMVTKEHKHGKFRYAPAE